MPLNRGVPPQDRLKPVGQARSAPADPVAKRLLWRWSSWLRNDG